MPENIPEELVQIVQKAKEDEINEKAGYKIQSDQLNKETDREINPGNPVVKAQKQISSQETAGVYSPQQE